MKSRYKARHRTAVKKRKLRFTKRLIKSGSETARKLWDQTFEFWKTLPDSMKTAVVLSFLSVSLGLLAPLFKSIRNCGELQVSPPERAETVRAEPQSDHAGGEPSRKLKSARSVREIQHLNNSPRTVPVTSVGHKSQSLADARQLVRLGNYGEAFRHFQVVVETLPQTERSRLAEDLNKANKMYERGEFREAAYRMRDKVDAVVSSN